MHENEISGIIVDCAFHIHTRLGPGLLESVFEAVLKYELLKRGLTVVTQQPMPVVWENVKLEIGFRAEHGRWRKSRHRDKIRRGGRTCSPEAASYISPAYGSETRAPYQFNVPLIKDGITRVVNNL